MKIDGKQVKAVYIEAYNDQAVLADEFIPTLKHIDRNLVVTYAQLLKAGSLADGRKFQEIRFILAEKPKSPLAYADEVLADDKPGTA